MTFYNELKSNSDIISTAKNLGYDGIRSGNSYQGNCPKHASSRGKCMVISERVQGFKCYNCGARGDVIDLVMLYKRCDHATAVKFLADRAGMQVPFDNKSLSPEELARHKAEADEESLIYDMLAEAAEWCHQQLKNFPAIVDHLQNHYGFSPEIIDEQNIGFAPPGTSGPDVTSDLANHLENIPRFRGKLAKSGLFSFNTPDGPLWDYFKGRIVFPFRLNGKVVNMIARATPLTPVNEWECYTDRQGNIKMDAAGNPDHIKYKKLRKHDPSDDKKKHISKFVGAETFMGLDSIRGAKQVIITEGAPDWVSAVDHGFAAISPVTTNFRDEDLEKLARTTKNADSIYIINDNEDNEAGLKGALKTGKHLTMQGRSVFLVELPRPTGLSKIDLNEYLRDHSADDLCKLMASAKSIPDMLIDKLPGDFIKAQPLLKQDLLPLLTRLDKGIQEYYLEHIRKKVKISKPAIAAELDDVVRDIESKKKQAALKPVDPVIQALANALAKDPALLRKRIDAVNESGVVNERNVIAMIFATLDSRLCLGDSANPTTLSIKISGHHGSGKSFAVKMCLVIYDDRAYYLMTGGSTKSLYYLQHGLEHKALIVAEAFQLQANNAADNEFAYVIRSLLSEGCVSYQVPQKDADGNFVTVEKRLDGPTSLITTTIIEKLEPQLEDRLFTIHPDESMDQTKAITYRTATIKDGSFKGIDSQIVEMFKLYHSMLKPVEVVIPYARQIVHYINQADRLPIATRRAFGRVLAIIQTVVCAYQFQRDKDDQGRLKADMADYWMALQIVREAFRETLGQQGKEATERLDFIRDNGPVQFKTLTSEWGVSKSALSGWVRSKVYDLLLAWCDENGDEFGDDASLKKAKRSGCAYLRVTDSYGSDDVTGLPTPYELTRDPDWDEGGKLLLLYDLALDQRHTFDSAPEVGSDQVDEGQDEDTPTVESEEAAIEEEDDFDFNSWDPSATPVLNKRN
jgi:DNA primase